MAMIIPFSKPDQKCWSQSEQSEFLRAVQILRRTGLPIITESGLSDEGDPWTVFLREDTGDVVVHICRIEGHVIAASAASPNVVSGPSFRSVIDRILKSQPLVLPTTQSSSSLFLHPSVVITAFIATAFSWSCSEEANLKQYAWNVDEDGVITAPQPPRAGSSRSILADAISSKTEASSITDGLNALSGRFAIAASIAAVALAADIAMKAASNTPWQDLMAQSSEADSPYSSASRVAPADDSDVSLFIADPYGDERATNSDLSSTKVPADGASDVAFFPWAHQRDDASASHDIPDLPLGSEADAAANSSLRPVELAFAVEPPPFVMSSPEASPVENHTARASSGDPTRPNSSGASPLLSTHETTTTDASEFLSYLLSQKVGFGHAGLHDLTEAVAVLATDHFRNADGGDAPATISDQRGPTPSDGGFKLVEDILNFAFDHANELSTSPYDWMAFSRGLKSNAFLPNADRVLIIDIPDLQADAFKFTDGLVMVSQEFATKYLPNTSLTAQSVLDVADGVTLKLIGVIDMTQTLHS